MIDLQIFCAPAGDARSYLEQPWTSGVWTYATEGHCLIRVPARADVSENKNAPNNVLTLFEGDPPKAWFQIPPCEVCKEQCKFCDGKGRDVECCECKGVGTVDIRNDYSEYPDLVCATCDGEGVIAECENCSGTGGLVKEDRIAIGDGGYQSRFLVLCATLPNCEIGPRGEDRSAWLRFDGGDGRLMPILPAFTYSPIPAEIQAMGS